MLFGNTRKGVLRQALSKDRGFIKRWPNNPKVIFFGAPNTF